MGTLSALDAIARQSEMLSKFSGAFGMNPALSKFFENPLLNGRGFGTLDVLSKFSREVGQRHVFEKFGINRWRDLLPNRFGKLAGLEDLRTATRFRVPRFELPSQMAIDKFASLINTQSHLSSAFSRLAIAAEFPWKNFNYLNSALLDHTYRFTRNVSHHAAWEDAEIALEANERISEIVEGISENSDTVDLTALKESLINELRQLLEKSSSDRARRFIFDLIAILGFMLTVYAMVVSERDISNRDAVEMLSQRQRETVTEIDSVIKAHFDSLDNKRICLANVRLRFSPNDRSKILGIVSQGQQVVVLEISHKWLLVSYLDQHTGRPMSGYVSKKYFKKSLHRGN